MYNVIKCNYDLSPAHKDWEQVLFTCDTYEQARLVAIGYSTIFPCITKIAKA